MCSFVLSASNPSRSIMTDEFRQTEQVSKNVPVSGDKQTTSDSLNSEKCIYFEYYDIQWWRCPKPVSVSESILQVQIAISRSPRLNPLQVFLEFF